MDRYILASQSPRRRELLHLVLNDYEVIPAQGEEVVRSTDPAEVVQELSLQKAMEVAKRVQPCEGDRIIVIGADTVVAVDGEILGKPEDRADAARMIGMIQGREHHVYTGVTVWMTMTRRLSPGKRIKICRQALSLSARKVPSTSDISPSARRQQWMYFP